MMWGEGETEQISIEIYFGSLPNEDSIHRILDQTELFMEKT